MKFVFWNVLKVLAALAVVAAILYAFLWPKSIAVDVAELKRGPLMVTVEEDGKTRIKDRYVVSAPLAGRLTRIQLRAGDAVETGKTLLAVIEPGDPELLDAREVAAAEARVKAAEAALKQAEPALEQVQALLDDAEADMARRERLYRNGAVTSEELADAKIVFRTQTEAYRSASFAKEIAQFELEQAQAALLRSRVDGQPTADTWRFEIHAPIDGSVLRVFQESSAIVAAGTQLIEVGDPRDLEIEIDVLSSDAVRIAPGNRVLLEHWGGENPLEGVVRVVEPAAFTKISALGVEEQRVNIIVDFVDPADQRQSLGDAYRVEARIVVWENDSILKVPTSALFRRGDQWAVFRYNDGHAKLQTVEIGHRSALEAEIVSGLDETDKVILHPSDQVEDGSAVVERKLDSG